MRVRLLEPRAMPQWHVHMRRGLQGQRLLGARAAHSRRRGWGVRA
eukprot:CAMPEP_0185376972 /NCGR_PEP_ID=MMETSP1364-20130426/40902_1 /TAXON_ID=38817 /ORGANISM="Gephyrocapsa oceanica, Strain RCC1303" /LENGTH=44 /DNA_ID= /DNA_START= /DNA_END= /DNA_ORIENTATION=